MLTLLNIFFLVATLSPLTIIVGILVLALLLYIIFKLPDPYKTGGLLVIALVLIFVLLSIFGII